MGNILPKTVLTICIVGVHTNTRVYTQWSDGNLHDFTRGGDVEGIVTDAYGNEYLILIWKSSSAYNANVLLTAQLYINSTPYVYLWYNSKCNVTYIHTCTF